MICRLQYEHNRYNVLHSQSKNPGTHLVRISDEESTKSVDSGDIGVLFTGHKDLSSDVLNGVGIFLSVDKISEIVEEGSQGSGLESISGFSSYDRKCVWCNEKITGSSGIEFQSINTVFSKEQPAFHSGCFLKFRSCLREIVERPEIISHSI